MHCLVVYGLLTGPFDLELVCNRAGAVDTGNAKGSSLCGATAVSSVAGECSLVGGGVSLIISSCGAAPGLPVDGQGSPLWLAMIEPLQRILNTKNLYLKIPTYLGRTAGIVSSMAVVWNWQGSLHTNYYCAALAESRQVPRAEYCSERIWLPNMAESVMEARALHLVRAGSRQSHHKVVMSINVHRCHLFDVVDRAGWLNTQEVSFPSYNRLYTGRAAGKMGVTFSTQTARWVR
jgi:hypothetical protein